MITRKDYNIIAEMIGDILSENRASSPDDVFYLIIRHLSKTNPNFNAVAMYNAVTLAYNKGLVNKGHQEILR